MTTDYNTFAKTFSKSRKNMKWAELDYFFSLLKRGSILDVGCGSGRLLEQYNEYFGEFPDTYTGVDLSSGLIESAKNNFPEHEFYIGNMLEIGDLLYDIKYRNIFLIASFHHLETLGEREVMMKCLFDICDRGGKIYMTHWALESPCHLEKYKNSKIEKSENSYGSVDFSIKIGQYQRFYHCFDLSELEYLAKLSGFKIIENSLFDNEKNIITILEK